MNWKCMFFRHDWILQATESTWIDGWAEPKTLFLYRCGKCKKIKTTAHRGSWGFSKNESAASTTDTAPIEIKNLSDGE